MNKILLPTDFSQPAEKAFRASFDLALKSDILLILFHVYTPIESTFATTEDERQLFNFEMNKTSLLRLQQLKEQVASKSCPVIIETSIARAPLTGSILSFAKDTAVDLFTLGTQCARGVKKIIVGSETSRIAQKSVIAVLFIPQNYEWDKPANIGFVTSHVLININALDLCIALAKLYGANTTIVLLVSGTKNTMDNVEMAAVVKFRKLTQNLITPFPLKFITVRTDSVKEKMENFHKKGFLRYAGYGSKIKELLTTTF